MQRLRAVLVTTAVGALALGAATAAPAGAGPPTGRGPGPLSLDNYPKLDGNGDPAYYTGGSDSTDEWCEPNSPEEWHFVITDVDTNVPPAGIAPPEEITVYFLTETLQVERVVVASRTVAHYVVADHLDDTLLGAEMTLPNGETTWLGQFLLSHAPCPSNEIDPPLWVEKTATPSYDRTYAWEIDKSVDPAHVDTLGSSATFDYTVEVTRDEGTDGNWVVTGEIAAKNPNDFEVPVQVTDSLPGATCVVDASEMIVPVGTPEEPGTATTAYSCSFDGPPEATGTNTATIEWAAGNGALDAGSASAEAPFDFGSVDPTLFGECADVTDLVTAPIPGEPELLGTVCASDSFAYSRTVDVPPSTCTAYDNTATYTTTDEDPEDRTTGSAGAEATACGPVAGGLSMGFWSNPNGQAIIKDSGPSSGVCDLTPWLRQYAPFSDLSATASCRTAASYVYNVVKAATAKNASMNAMLKAQMLAAALDVYFSDPDLGDNRIGAPVPIGSVSMNLDDVCTDLTCGSTEDTSGSFGGASCLSVSDMLAYAASRSNPGGSIWYGNVKFPDQEYAKDAFEMIANQKAYACT